MTENPQKIQRRRWSAEEKLKIIEEARSSGHSVSEVCRRHQVAPGQFYAWEKQAKAAALEGLRASTRPPKREDPEKAALKAELDRMRVVIAEISAENIEIKKRIYG
jgi:transposase